MCREIIYFCAELLNYWSMTFFGLKLFAKVYGFEVHKNKIVENGIYALMCLPISWHAAGNYIYATYSTLLTYLIIIYMYVLIRFLYRKKERCSIILISLYILIMRLFDLWIIAVVTEVSKISRDVEVNLISIGDARVWFMLILSLVYLIIYYWCAKNNILKYLEENKIYSCLICLYSLFGNGCFCTVYRFEYGKQLIGYWTFYLVCAFVFIGGFLFYIVKNKNDEKEKILMLRNDMLEMNYYNIQKNYETIRTLQHDYKNHMLAVSELIRDNKIDKSLCYIQTYIDYTNNSLDNIKSGNKIIDIIVNSKILEAKDKGISFVYEIDYVESINIEDMDMCSLIANLLDNAIEACEKVVYRKPEIILKIIKKDAVLIIQIVNSIHEDAIKKKYFFNTEKEHSQLHGWGIKSVERVINKYHGTKEYYIENSKVEMFITIPM